MSIQFRNSRMNRTYLTRVAAAVAADKAAPATPATGRPGVPGAGQAGARAGAARPAPKHDRGASVLEVCHPDIVKAISLLWGYPEMNEYFDRLWIADNKQGPIDPEAMSELMVLARVHQMLMPQRPGRTMASFYGSNRMFDPPASTDPWGDVPPRR